MIGCQSVIDLKNNMLVIGDTTTPFLHESELPDYARLNSLPGSVVSMDEDRQLAEALQRSATDAPVAGVSPGKYSNTDATLAFLISDAMKVLLLRSNLPGESFEPLHTYIPVSYTHLTLPTKRIV